MSVTSHTQLDATKQALVAKIVQRELNFIAKLMQTVEDVSVHAVAGSKTVSFPKSGGFTVENRAPGVAGTTQNLLYTNDTLTLDYRAHVQWLIENYDAYQSNVEVASDYIKKAGTAHARNIDLRILSTLDTNAGYTQAGPIDKSKIINAIQFLDQNHALDEDRYLVIKPSDRNAMLNISDFVRADSMGSSNIPKGVIGEVYGAKVITHAGATKSFLYSKEAISWAFQVAPKYGEQGAIEYGNGSVLAVVDQLYGHKAVRLSEGVQFDGVTALGATESPFIAQIG